MVSRRIDQQPRPPQRHCPDCNEDVRGYRGQHELERHIAREHSRTRKGFVCIDASADHQFLAKCKHCSGQKVYWAYYNAAAHLRRAHFHPRTRKRTGRSTEGSRTHTNPGDDPPMDVLRRHWIKEIEVENTDAIESSPGSTSPVSSPQQELLNDSGRWNEPQSISWASQSPYDNVDHNVFEERGSDVDNQFSRLEFLPIAQGGENMDAPQFGLGTFEAASPQT